MGCPAARAPVSDVKPRPSRRRRRPTVQSTSPSWQGASGKRRRSLSYAGRAETTTQKASVIARSRFEALALASHRGTRAAGDGAARAARRAELDARVAIDVLGPLGGRHRCAPPSKSTVRRAGAPAPWPTEPWEHLAPPARAPLYERRGSQGTTSNRLQSTRADDAPRLALLRKWGAVEGR